VQSDAGVSPLVLCCCYGQRCGCRITYALESAIMPAMILKTWWALQVPGECSILNPVGKTNGERVCFYALPVPGRLNCSDCGALLQSAWDLLQRRAKMRGERRFALGKPSKLCKVQRPPLAEAALPRPHTASLSHAFVTVQISGAREGGPSRTLPSHDLLAGDKIP
jgi:hypothetical protein